MPRLRSLTTGVVVNVDEATANTLPDEFRMLDEGAAPRGNASRDEWAAHARSLSIEVPEDAKRDDIKTLVRAHASTE